MSEIKKYNKNEFIEMYNPVKCLTTYSKINSIPEAISDGSPSLSKLKKQYSDEFILSYILLWIININEFLNVSRNMNPEQMKELSIMIYNEYYYFKISDLNLAFKRMKSGYYGQFYEGIDGVKVMSMLEKYADERYKYFIRKMEDEKQKHY